MQKEKRSSSIQRTQDKGCVQNIIQLPTKNMSRALTSSLQGISRKFDLGQSSQSAFPLPVFSPAPGHTGPWNLFKQHFVKVLRCLKQCSKHVLYAATLQPFLHTTEPANSVCSEKILPLRTLSVSFSLVQAFPGGLHPLHLQFSSQFQEQSLCSDSL